MVRIPAIPSTRSGLSRPIVPEESDHRFRSKPTTRRMRANRRWVCSGVGGLRVGVGSQPFPHGSSFQSDPVGVVDESIEDRVRECGVADDVVPVLERQLTGDEGGAAGVAVLEHFEHVASLGDGERRQAEVVEDEELGPRELLEQLGEGAIGAGEREFTEQSREAVVVLSACESRYPRPPRAGGAWRAEAGV